jgi:hypothetical protein
MSTRDKWIDTTKLDKLNASIKKNGTLDRQDILNFLTYIDTTDANVIVTELRSWLSELHNNTEFPSLKFTDQDINDVIGDLDSYGVIQSDTILKFKEISSRNLT